MAEVWGQCLSRLQSEISEAQFDTCLRPLQADAADGRLTIYSPNRYILERVTQDYLPRISEVAHDFGIAAISINVGCRPPTVRPTNERTSLRSAGEEPVRVQGLDPGYTFSTFVEGHSNMLARASAAQVAERIGCGGRSDYNPLLLYGGVGLGKTHLMCAVGNEILLRRPYTKVFYTNSQRFMEEMVSGLERGQMKEFIRRYGDIEVLLMDDVQFLAKGPKTQEEFFHLFNRLRDNGRQLVLTSDKYPSEIEALDERLKSRFVYGITACVEPPDLETRVAILRKKSRANGVELSNDVAFYLAERIKSNVREMEGALKRVMASARFLGNEINIELVKEVLKDLFAFQERQISMENIQKTVAAYYKIRVADLHSKKRTRSITRPRQLAMAIAKAITNHSLPEIGAAFGDRDHTTVLHACRKIEELRAADADLDRDFHSLVKILDGRSPRG
jgi:chromosomal replication initiator protein